MDVYRHQRLMRAWRGKYIACLLLLLAACGVPERPVIEAPQAEKIPAAPPDTAMISPEDILATPPLSPEDALATFTLADGFRIELVAAEPLIEDPVAIDFDAAGRMWVVEMRSFMPNVRGEGEHARTGRVSVLEDTDGDGRMDKVTRFLEGLVLPRAIKVLEHGVLVAEPPYLWLVRDTTGDLLADTREIVRDDYGVRDSNPERNPSGLIWTIDNWIVSTYYNQRLRIGKDGTWKAIPTLNTGQWGVGMDDYGRIYRNWNEGPLYVDLVPDFYFARNPNLERHAGAYVEIAVDREVWPARPNPGVNRGYRNTVLREDGRLRSFTAAGSPVVFRGDRLPSDLINDVFVSEPAGNLVRRFTIRGQGSGTLAAYNAYQETEFLTSTDERFRPVNFYSGPDGTLYVVDFYRGIIQHREYLTEYLEHYIQMQDLDRPLGLGRVFRIVHEDFTPDRSPMPASMSPDELVQQLLHPNGWRRDTAQRILVERQEVSVAPALRRIIASASDDRFRLHALWALAGLDAVDSATLQVTLNDRSDYVRAAALRIAIEGPAGPVDDGAWPAFELPGPLVRDPAPIVFRQLAASLGALQEPDRSTFLEGLLLRHASDTVTVDAALGGLHGSESAFLQRLLRHPDREELRDAIEMATAAALNGGDGSVRSYAGDTTLADWQRAAVRAGIRRLAPPPRGPDVPPLTEDEQQRYEMGSELYASTCAPCHGADGEARTGQGAPLTGSDWVLGDIDPLIRIVLHGKEGQALMPPMRELDDEEISAILTFVRRTWGNEATAVSPGQVREVRGRTAFRQRPWTAEELSD